MSSPRQRAKDLMAVALDERNNSDKERLAAAFKALKIIRDHSLLDSPLDGILQSDNETVQAAATIFDRLTDPTLVASVKKIAGGISRARGGGRRYGGR